MKTLKAARKARDAVAQAMLRKAVWTKFVRGLRCPYCTSPYFGDKEQFQRHLDLCRAKMERDLSIQPNFKKSGAYKKWMRER